MSHFYGTLNGNRGQTTRQGTKRTGLTAVAASWAGCVKVYVYIDQQGRDAFVIYQDTWQGAGTRQDIARGVLGQEHRTPVTTLHVLQELFDDWLTLTEQDASDGNAEVIALTEKVQSTLNDKPTS